MSLTRKCANLLITFTAILITPYPPACLSQWIEGNGTQKEYFLDASSNEMNFYEAGIFCDNLRIGARLPEIMTQQENEAIFQLIKPFPYYATWLGAELIQKSGSRRFIWRDSGEFGCFTNWWRNSNQPDYSLPGVLMWSNAGEWFNANYNDRFAMTVCEFALRSTVVCTNQTVEESPDDFQ